MENRGYIRSNTVSFAKENLKDRNTLYDRLPKRMIDETEEQYRQRLRIWRDEKYQFDENLVLGELDEEFEAIPYDGEEWTPITY